MDIAEPNIVNLTLEPVVMPNKDYVDPKLNTTAVEVPRTNVPRTSSKGRLKLNNEELPTDDSLELFLRTGKHPYREVQYRNHYTPPDFKEQKRFFKQSEQLADQGGQQTDRPQAN